MCCIEGCLDLSCGEGYGESSYLLSLLGQILLSGLVSLVATCHGLDFQVPSSSFPYLPQRYDASTGDCGVGLPPSDLQYSRITSAGVS